MQRAEILGDERDFDEFDPLGKVGLLQELLGAQPVLMVVLDGDDTAKIVGARRSGEQHRRAAAAELEDQPRPVAAHLPEEIGGELAGHLEAVVREGGQNALELQVRQHGNEVHSRRQALAQFALVAVVLRHDQRAQRGDFLTEPGDLRLGSFAVGGERRDAGIERRHALVQRLEQAGQPTREE